MELIINLIIILVIIFSVLKRLKGTSEKVKELEKPSPAVPKTGRETPQKEPGARGILKELFKELEESSREKPIEQPVAMQRSEQETDGHVPSSGEDTFELSQEELIKTAQEELSQTTDDRKRDSQDFIQKIPVTKPVKQFHLIFYGPDVVRGIVMSEILGPPVSMR